MTSERIAIIGGTGDQGKGLASRWALAGREIIIGSRDASRAEAAATEISERLAVDGRVRGTGNSAAAGDASIIVLTVPFAAQVATIKEFRDHLKAGSLVVDMTVPLEAAIGGRPSRILGVWAGSAAEQCAELLPNGSEVVSGFHNVAAGLLADLEHDVDCDVLVCGDSKAAKERLRPLVEAIRGCRYVDAGPLANSRTVEALTALLIGINIRYKTHSGLRITGL
ncbi:MAG: NADPH-dependent F420 reductase [Acidobacteriota bacterium]